MKKHLFLLSAIMIINIVIAAELFHTVEAENIIDEASAGNTNIQNGKEEYYLEENTINSKVENIQEVDYTGTEMRLDFFNGTRASGTGNKLYAVWIENSDESFIQNLFICTRANLQNIQGPGLPFWHLNKRPLSSQDDIDAVTGATQKDMDFTINATLDANVSNFTIYFEVDHSWDGNDWFTDQPAILYAADIDLTQPDTTYELQFKGWTWNGRSGILRSTTPSVTAGEFQDEKRYITHTRDDVTGDFDVEDLLSRMATYMVDSISITLESIVPVELTSFTAEVNGSNVELNWQTATEVNNYGFIVERRACRQAGKPGIEDWEEAGFVKGSGNSNATKLYSFTDKFIDDNKGSVKYRLKQIDTDGKYEYSKEIEVSIERIPVEFDLEQNFPNPFNPSTTIKYSLPSGKKELQSVQLIIYDITGQEIKTLVNEEQSTGSYQVSWDGKDNTGIIVGSGIYFYRLTMGDNFSKTNKMIIVK